jgi:protease-4
LAIGDRATLRSWWKPYSEDERAAAMAGIQASYDYFISRVAAARAMTPEMADSVARGRVWSGVRATEVGLVDRYGGMHEAVERAARMAGLSDSGPAPLHVVHYPPEPTLLDQIRSLFGLDLRLPLGLGGGERGVGAASFGIDPLAGRALGFGDPLLRALRLVPPALWRSSQPQALALGPCHVEIDD